MRNIQCVLAISILLTMAACSDKDGSGSVGTVDKYVPTHSIGVRLANLNTDGTLQPVAAYVGTVDQYGMQAHTADWSCIFMLTGAYNVTVQDNGDTLTLWDYVAGCAKKSDIQFNLPTNCTYDATTGKADCNVDAVNTPMGMLILVQTLQTSFEQLPPEPLAAMDATVLQLVCSWPRLDDSEIPVDCVPAI